MPFVIEYAWILWKVKLSFPSSADNPAHVPNRALIPCTYLCTNTCNSFGNAHQRVNCHNVINPCDLSYQTGCTVWRYVTWLITCLLRACSALYCKLSAGLSCQAVSSGVAGYSCLPDGPNPTPSLLHLHEVHLVRAVSWQINIQPLDVHWLHTPMHCEVG